MLNEPQKFINFARIYLVILKNGRNLTLKKIERLLGMTGGSGNYIDTLLKMGLLLKIGEGADYLPINPKIFSYMTDDNLDEKKMKIMINLNKLWAENFLSKSFEFELIIHSKNETVAWENFCGWIDHFKNESSYVKFFSPTINIASDKSRISVLENTLKKFEGSFNIFTVENKKDELVKFKNYFEKKFLCIPFNGYIIPTNFYFNKYFRVALIGNVLGTITLERGSKYTGPLFYRNIEEIRYIDECFKYIESVSHKI